ITVDIESHGRGILPDLDLSRTIGWFTSIQTVSLALDPQLPPAAAPAAVRNQLRNPRSEPFATPRFAFNYLGRFDAECNSWPLAPTRAGSPGPAPQCARAAPVGD